MIGREERSTLHCEQLSGVHALWGAANASATCFYHFVKSILLLSFSFFANEIEKRRTMLGRKQNERVLTLQSTRSQMFLSRSLSHARCWSVHMYVCMYIHRWMRWSPICDFHWIHMYEDVDEGDENYFLFSRSAPMATTTTRHHWWTWHADDDCVRQRCDLLRSLLIWRWDHWVICSCFPSSISCV